jgi:alpha-1,3-glucan synthase
MQNSKVSNHAREFVSSHKKLINFLGLWSLGTPTDMDEVCRVFNLDKNIVEKYVQFGGVFNLLHAGASYLRIHQRGFGAVGVSGKYGKRSKQRYPIFWGLPKIGSLPNPDPADTAERDVPGQAKDGAVVDSAMESNRGVLRCRAQEWAGLTVDPEVSLFLILLQPTNSPNSSPFVEEVFSSCPTLYSASRHLQPSNIPC